MSATWESLYVMLDSDCPTPCCVPDRPAGKRVTLPLNVLKKVVAFSKKHDLPLVVLATSAASNPKYTDVLRDTDHRWILPPSHSLPPDEFAMPIISIDEANSLAQFNPITAIKYRFSESSQLLDTLRHALAGGAIRVNLLLEDLAELQDEGIKEYEHLLDELVQWVANLVSTDRPLEVDILTDRLMLTEMKHCSAGEKHLTVGPDGHLYPCPHFYRARGKKFDCTTPEDYHYGPFKEEIEVPESKNLYLFHFERAPICQACDAFHCHRCVYLNWLNTLEPLVPSRVQCRVATAERNASAKLRHLLIERGIEQDKLAPMPELLYQDPFDYCEEKGYPVPGDALSSIYRESIPGVQVVRQSEAPLRHPSVQDQELISLRQQVRNLSDRVEYLEQQLAQVLGAPAR